MSKQGKVIKPAGKGEQVIRRGFMAVNEQLDKVVVSKPPAGMSKIVNLYVNPATGAIVAETES